MDRNQFMDEATERFKKNLKIDMEYCRVAFLRKQARTQGYKSELFETIAIVYVAMIGAFVIGLLAGVSGWDA